MSTHAATQAHIQLLRQAHDERLEDVEFMIANGAANEAEVAHRLGISPIAFERWCYRNGHQALFTQLTAYRARERDPWKANRKEIYA